MARITLAILDLAAVSPDDAIIFCPVNHNPSTRLAPYPGAPGSEGATCLASQVTDVGPLPAKPGIMSLQRGGGRCLASAPSRIRPARV